MNPDEPTDQDILESEFDDPTLDPSEKLDSDISKDSANAPMDKDEILDDELNIPLTPAESGEEDISGSAPDAEPTDIDEELEKFGLAGDKDDENPKPLGVDTELADEEL